MAIKNVYNIEKMVYKFDNERKGAKFQYLDEVEKSYKWGNGGDIYEVALAWSKGLPAHKDPNGSYDTGSDLEEFGTSVKSWGFTLASIKAESFEETLDIYWKNVKSWNWSFGWIEGDELIEYNMNADEFNQFLYRFAKFDKYSKAVRGPKMSNKKRIEVEAWFEERL